MAARLRNATSPYLLQHAGNPVDWWPWCDEAFEEARARDVPVLLSVGYSACHWCHVMAHESFADPQTAALLNDSVVAIKVDREERPDVDAVYMTATQAMTGQGGWPMTVFMTPDREPFYCGTYYPREHFRRLVQGVADAWRTDRAGVTGQAKQIATALAGHAAPPRTSPAWATGLPGTGTGLGTDGAGTAGSGTDGAGSGTDGTGSGTGGTGLTGPLRDICDHAVATLRAQYDEQNAGFGSAPKFPPSMVCEFLLRHSERPGASPDALRMAEGTAGAMARGGMYDQLGGGFARYSVDARWVIPHFEKMLYDNALLARVYTHLWRRTGSDLAARVARETCGWLLADLRTPDGGFASALDADSDGAEGLFYTWTPQELADVLGAGDGEWASMAFGMKGSGNFEGGRSVLQRLADPADADRFARIRGTLFSERHNRVHPARDDKVVAAWNGLAIAALAEAGVLLAEPAFVAAATAAAELLARVHLREGRLARTSRDGAAGPSAGVLEDYACVAEGFLALSGATGQGRWAGLAGQLLEVALARFTDGSGGFFDTADDGEALVYRPADPGDGPTPSGTFALAGALLSYSALTGSARHRAAAIAALGVVEPFAARAPRAAGWGLAVAEAVLSGPVEIAVAGAPDDPRTGDLHRAALHAAPPGAVIALGDGTGSDGGSDGVPLLAGRGLVDGAPAAYVCRNFTCHAPVTDPAALRAALAAG